MDIFSSIATAVAAAILSLPVVTPTTPPQPEQSSRVIEPIQISESEKTIGTVEISAAEYVAPPPRPTPVLNKPTDTKAEWLAGSGLAESDWGYVDYIINRESRWDPNATNRYSGAHGLPQALPYGKTGCGWVDAICQLRWANGYAVGRYGSWAGAYSYWLTHRYW